MPSMKGQHGRTSRPEGHLIQDREMVGTTWGGDGKKKKKKKKNVCRKALRRRGYFAGEQKGNGRAAQRGRSGSRALCGKETLLRAKYCGNTGNARAKQGRSKLARILGKDNVHHLRESQKSIMNDEKDRRGEGASRPLGGPRGTRPATPCICLAQKKREYSRYR